MKRLTYTGSFWQLALMSELRQSGIQVITINGNVHREPDEIVPATELVVSVEDDQPTRAVNDVVDAHDAVAAMSTETAKRARITSNITKVEKKLRFFYKDTIGLTDEEIDDSGLPRR